MPRSTLMLAAACLVSLAARAETVPLHATLSGAAEVPPKTTEGKGTFAGSLDTTTRMLNYTVDYGGLSGPATAGHLHGPADPGANAGVTVPFSPPLTSPIKGQATLTEAQMADLLAGKYYANLHTAANPGGEVRGQVTK